MHRAVALAVAALIVVAGGALAATSGPLTGGAATTDHSTATTASGDGDAADAAAASTASPTDASDPATDPPTRSADPTASEGDPTASAADTTISETSATETRAPEPTTAERTVSAVDETSADGASDGDASAGDAGGDASGADDTRSAVAGPSTRRSVADVQRGVVNVLEVRATGSGDYDYAFTVRGFVQRARVTDRIKAESTDAVSDGGDGTVTVRGSTGNEQSDAFLVRGRVVSYRKTGGSSGGALVRNGLPVSAEDLRSGAHVFEVVSRDEDAEVNYRFAVSGRVEKASADGHSADDDDRVATRDGTATVRGSTGDQSGDAYRVTGTITGFEKTGGDSAYFLRYDGLAFAPAEFGASNGNDGSAGDGGDDDGGDDDGGDGGSPAVTPVEECTVIDRPGSYALTRDVRDSDAETCIRITASRVTFDGNGHLVDGVDAADSVGVDVAPAARRGSVRDVVVRNVRARDWAVGVRAGDERTDRSVSNVSVRGVTSASNARYGVELSDASDSAVVDSVARENDAAGVYLYGLGADNAVRDTAASANRIGVVAFEGGTGLVLRDNRVRNNERYGIDTTNGDRNARVVGNVVSNNGRSGLDLDESAGVTVRDNTVRGNGGSGVDFEDVARIGAVAGNTVRGNGAYGIVLQSASGATVRDNAVRDNAENGVALLERVRDVTVRANTVCGNADPQILVGDDARNATVTGNRVTCR